MTRITCDIPADNGFFMQTDTVPFCIFNEKLNEVQENVFTVTTAVFSRYLVHLGELSRAGETAPSIVDIKRNLVANGFMTDKAGNLVVEINPSEVMPNHTYPAFVRDCCIRLSSIHVKFRLGDWNGIRNAEAVQSLFVGVISPEDLEKARDRRVYVSLNNWAIPYFLFYGAYDIYFGKVQKNVALSLKGQTNKRMYKMICSMYGKKGNRCEMSLDDLRRMLNLSGEVRRKNFAGDDEMEFYITGKKNYKRADKIREVLDQSAAAIKESGSDYWFEYELLSRSHNGKRGRQRMDTVIFTVYNRGSNCEASPVDEKRYSEVCNLLTLFANHGLFPVYSVVDTADRIVGYGAAVTILRKHEYYKEKLFKTGSYDPLLAPDIYEKHLKHEFNIISKILKTDYQIILPRN